MSKAKHHISTMQLVPIDADGNVPLAAEDKSGSLQNVIEQMVALYGRRGFQRPWIGYVAVEDGLCVGTCAFTGPPANDEVEVAYFTFPGYEGRGVASRMAAALVDQTQAAVAEKGLTFTAHTLPQESASTRILRRLGFTLLGDIVHPEDGTVWKWRK